MHFKEDNYSICKIEQNMKMKRSLILGIVILLLASGINASLVSANGVNEIEKENNVVKNTDFAGGNGTAENPYLIENVTQLQNMNKNLSAHYKLIDDINASETRNWNDGTGFDPVGNETLGERFEGSINGDGHEITDLLINRTNEDYVGLLGCVGNGGYVNNITLLEANISGNGYVGGLVGKNYDKVKRSYVSGTVIGINNGIGGLVGENTGTLNTSYSQANVSGNDYIGGLVGYNSDFIQNTYAIGNVSEASNNGGLVGYNNGGTVEDSYYPDDEPNSPGTGLPRENMTGASASGNMSFDFVNTWQTVEKQHDDATENGYPILASLDRNTQLRAQDILQYHNLSVNINGLGTVDIEPDKAEYEHDEKVDLTAIPDENQTFVEWTGDYTGTEKQINLTMDSDKQVTANFEVKTHNLTVNTVGSGTVNVEPDKEEYEHGKKVNLTAQPDEGYEFINWTGDYTGTEKQINLTINSDKEVTANFEIKTYDLTINTVGNGTVNIEPDKTKYEHGEKVNLTAVPAEGHEFIEWTGNYSGTEEKINLIMDSNKEVTANFEIKTYDLTITTVGNGTVNIEPDKTKYEHGEVVNLTVEPDEGYEFVNWTGDHTGTEVQLNLTMDSNKEITANFEIKTYDLIVNTVGEGDVDIEPDKAEYEYGEKVDLTAVPEEGYEFVKWTEDVSSTEDKISITIDSDKTISAHFGIKTYSLTVDTDGEGSVNIEPDKTEYERGDKVNLTAESDDGYEFVNWTGDYTGTSDKISITMDADISVTANFLQTAQFEVNVTDFDKNAIEGEEISVNYTVENKGEIEGSKTVEHKVNGAVIDELELTLKDGEVHEGQLTWIAEDPTQNKTISIQTEDDSDNVVVEVVALESKIELSNLQVTPEGPEAGDKIDIELDVKNTGSSSIEYTVMFKLDGKDIGKETVHIQPGKTKTVSLSHTIENPDDYEVKVGDKTQAITVKENGNNSEDLPIPTNFVYLGLGALFIVILFTVIAKRGKRNNQKVEREGKKETTEDSENYDISEEDEDDIDLYGT